MKYSSRSVFDQVMLQLVSYPQKMMAQLAFLPYRILRFLTWLQLLSLAFECCKQCERNTQHQNSPSKQCSDPPAHSRFTLILFNAKLISCIRVTSQDSKLSIV